MNRDTPFFNLASEDMPGWLIGARPSDHEPPPEGPGGVTPCPKGVDAVRWAYADERGAEADGAGGKGVRG